MTAAGVTALAMTITLCAPIAARGGPVLEEETPWDRAQAARTASRWKAAGRRAVPEIARVICDEQEGALLAEAETAARGLGATAVPALAAAFGRRDCLRGDHLIAASMLCAAEGNENDPGEVRAATTALLRMLDSPDQQPVATEVLALALGRQRHPKEPPVPCPARQTISDAARGDLLGRLARGSSRRSADVTGLVGLLRPPAPEAVALLARRLDGNRDRPHHVVQALVDMASAAAPATPALRALLAHSLALRHGPNPEGGDGQMVVAVHPPPWLSGTQAALRALAAIGPGAGTAGEEVMALVRASAERACDPLDVEVIAAALPAQLAVTPGRTGEPIAALDRALARQAACTAGPPAAEGTQRAWRASRALVKAIAATHAAVAAPLAPRLAALMRAPPVPDVELRLDAARLLTAMRAPLGTVDAALRHSLMVRSSHQPWDAAPPAPVPASYWEERSARVAVRALTSCRAEAGRPAPGSQALAEALSAAHEENERLVGCLARRLCGPDLRAYRQTLGLCCEYAYTARAPAWCTSYER